MKILSQTFIRVTQLAARNEIVVSEHGYDELSEDHIDFRDILAGLKDAIVLEDYPDYHKGPCVLVLQRDSENQPIHAVWGIPKNAITPAFLVTAYRPDSSKWANNFMRRKK